MNVSLFLMALALSVPAAFACPGEKQSGDQAHVCEHHGKMSCQHEKVKQAKAGAAQGQEGPVDGAKKITQTADGEKSLN